MAHLYTILILFLNLIFIPVFGYYTAVITTNVCLLILGFSGFFLKEYKKLQVVNYHELIKKASETGLSVQLDTGNSTIGEVEQAVRVVQETGNKKLIVHRLVYQLPLYHL